MLVITKTLKINNFRTTSSNSINLATIRKLMECSLRKLFVKANFYSYYFRDIVNRM